jgi:hypothetical protein
LFDPQSVLAGSGDTTSKLINQFNVENKQIERKMRDFTRYNYKFWFEPDILHIAAETQNR